MQFLQDNLEEQFKQIPFVGETFTPEMERLKGGMKRLAVSKAVSYTHLTLPTNAWV